MIKWVALVFAFWGVLGHVEPAPQCTVDGLSRQCDVLKKEKSTQWIYLEDGTYFRNPDYDSSFWSYIYNSGYTSGRISKPRQDRIVELVGFARESMIRSIQRGRSFESLSTAERSEILRLRTVKFDIEQCLSDQSTTCAAGSPNAYYSGADHHFTICRSAMMLPDLSLLLAIGHELGHAIDPCAMTLSAEAQQGAAILHGDFPQKSELQCFAREGFQQTMSEEQKLAYAHRRVLLDVLGDDSRPGTEAFWLVHQPEVDVVLEWLGEHPTCANAEGMGNSIRETIADMWAARVLADYRSKHPVKDVYEPFTMFAMFLSGLCGPRANAVGGDSEDVHLPSRARMDRVILTNPDLQKFLGCTAKGPSCDMSSVGEAAPAAVGLPPAAR